MITKNKTGPQGRPTRGDLLISMLSSRMLYSLFIYYLPLFILFASFLVIFNLGTETASCMPTKSSSWLPNFSIHDILKHNNTYVKVPLEILEAFKPCVDSAISNFADVGTLGVITFSFSHVKWGDRPMDSAVGMGVVLGVGFVACLFRRALSGNTPALKGASASGGSAESGRGNDGDGPDLGGADVTNADGIEKAIINAVEVSTQLSLAAGVANTPKGCATANFSIPPNTTLAPGEAKAIGGSAGSRHIEEYSSGPHSPTVSINLNLSGGGYGEQAFALQKQKLEREAVADPKQLQNSAQCFTESKFAQLIRDGPGSESTTIHEASRRSETDEAVGHIDMEEAISVTKSEFNDMLLEFYKQIHP
jgi:hypothetical protein